jgi:hypothetical protein
VNPAISDAPVGPDGPPASPPTETTGRTDLLRSAGWLALSMAALVTVVQTVVTVFGTGIWAGDLPAYLVGWRLARTPELLYNLDAQRSMAGTVLNRSGSVPACPFNYPPHLAAVGRFLPAMSYDGVLTGWMVLSGVLLGALIWTWTRISRYRMAVGIAVLASPPVAVSLLTGSILPIAAAGAIAAVVSVKRTGWAWTMFGALGWIAVATKPHLAVVLAAACLILATRRAFVSLIAAAPVIVGLPTVLMGPRIWTSWVSFLGQFSRSSESDLMCRVPRMAPNLEGILTRAGWAPPVGLVWFGYIATISALIIWILRTRPSLTHAAMLAAALVPLSAPHANPQDLLLCVPLLVLPATRSAKTANIWAGVVAFVLLTGTDNFTIAVQLGVAVTLGMMLFRSARNRPSLLAT